MTVYIFFLVFLAVFVLLNIYISKRFVQRLDIDEKYKLYFRYFLLINFFGIIGYVTGRYLVDFPSWLYFILSLPIGVLFLLFCTALIYDLFSFIVSKAPITESRRTFLKRSLDISSLMIAAGVSSRAMYEATLLEHEKINVKIKGLHQEYKIVQLSDIHIGGLINFEFMNILVQRVNKIKPDLVVITGDLVDVDLKKADKELGTLQNLKSVYGTYYVVGNHEYFHGVEAIIEKVKSLGIRVLENENVYIGEEGKGFNLAGVYDLIGYRRKKFVPNIYRALENCLDAPTVLLAHQPRFIKELSSGVDLMLSGHTHGGQLYPFKFLVHLQQPYISGLYQHNDDLQIYVNRGTGFWGPPMRLGSTAEITELILS